MEIGKKLVELCKSGKSMEVVNTLYSPNIVSVEAMSSPSMPAKTEGLAAVKEKNESWYKAHEVHSGVVSGPWPNGDRFVVGFKYEITPKTGKMAGKRMTIDEAALYTVKDDKIVKEEFFYDMGG
jgi:ketosteroid isomerase-like protein